METMEQTRIAANEALARAFFAAQDRLRGGPDATLCATEYLAELGGNPPMPLEHHQGFALAFYAGFPDMQHEIIALFATESAAAVRFVLHGTHTGTLFGIPATGRAVRITANVLLHIRDGRVERLQGVFDEAGMLRQLGVLS